MKTFFDRAKSLDASDDLANFRGDFLFPQHNGKDVLYFAGNSLGLQPRKTRDYICDELEDWARLGVEGHLNARHPWLPYHEFLTESVARLVGALPHEVVTMNSVSVNLHLMMVSFYRPTKARHKIVIEGGAFPSDQYAVESQLKFHGFSRESSLIELKPRPGEDLLRAEDILDTIHREGDTIALVLLGNVNYLTGQYYDIPAITEASHKVGAFVGFDLAHGIGNLRLQLHDDGPDFAVWCNYKYLNGGPGAIGGAFVHDRHAQSRDLPRFAGWWGHNKKTRFQMGPNFDPLPGAEGWQLSNPPIFQLAALRASLEVFDRATMPRLAKKSESLTLFLEEMLRDFPSISIVTPGNPKERGTQLSLRISDQAKNFVTALADQGIVCDFREPDILRIAPVALYTRFEDLVSFVEKLKGVLGVR